ncbi:MAG: hypothetical protein GKR88_18580 [Flavobacteriaceae bacterium]|nr:MAG: hypothetical protein GKR88_18580 [Flavobacteriaceae bacterium]
MKQIFIKIQSVLLAFMILIASNSYAITSHFCGTELVDVSLFGNPKACGTESFDADCSYEKASKKKCCKDVIEIIEPEVLNKIVEFKFSKKELQFADYFVVSYITSFQNYLFHKKVFDTTTPPPDSIPDILVLHQTFLI